MVVGYGRYDNNGISTWEVFEKAIEKDLHCIYIEDLYWHSDTLLTEFRTKVKECINNTATSIKNFNTQSSRIFNFSIQGHHISSYHWSNGHACYGKYDE